MLMNAELMGQKRNAFFPRPWSLGVWGENGVPRLHPPLLGLAHFLSKLFHSGFWLANDRAGEAFLRNVL